MGSEIVRPEDQDAPPVKMPEVEFALVLSRMIESVKNDPEHLRQTIYELARHKLQEQLTNEGHGERQQLSRALEAAIHGVEEFVKSDEVPAWSEKRALVSPQLSTRALEGNDWPLSRPASDIVEAQTVPAAVVERRLSWGATIVRLGLVLAIPGAIAFALYFGVARRQPRSDTALAAVPLSSAPQKPVVVSASPVPAPVPSPSPLIPKTYGVYAVSADHLYQLELLPGRAPDMRVAISALIASPSHTTLPDGHIKFIVYRRDSGMNAVDQADVRIVAKIAREMTFDKTGKPVVSKAGDGWVIRNIAIPYGIAPNKDDPDMYEIQSDAPDKALPSGRYALVVKGQSYDFTVEGEVTDLRHCLERLAAVNGQFYSECKK